MFFGIRRALSTEQGVSLLELAIVLPVVLLLIAGLVDFGFKVNAVKTVSTAARHAARVAAGHSRLLSAGVLCGPPIEQARCPAAAASAIDPSPANPVTSVAVQAACNYLSSAGIDATDYTISSAVTIANDLNMKPFQMAEVSIRHRDQLSGCVVRYERISRLFVTESSSRFILEGACL